MENKYNAHRAVRESLLLPYEPVMRRLVAVRQRTNEDAEFGVLSDKIAAKMCGVSERQIRKARFIGMNPYLADHICVKGLGLHPKEVFGDEWITLESFWAEELYSRVMAPEEAAERSLLELTDIIPPDRLAEYIPELGRPDAHRQSA